MSSPKKTGLPKDWSKKIFDNRVVNKQHHRAKNVIPGTAGLERRDGPISTQKPVGNGGKYNEGSYVGGYLGPGKYVNKKTGKADPEMGKRKDFEKEHFLNFLQENLEVSPKKPVHGSWKPKR